MNNKILELININKIYETKVEKIHVLKDINFSLNMGDFVSIQGKSGSGKSTLLNILGLLDKSTSGKLKIEDIEIGYSNQNLLNDIRNKKIGFVFQFHYLLNEFSALENVTIPALIDKNIDKKNIIQRGKELLEMVGLENRMSHRPLELSGGEKQRVAIARALINNPIMILADEPTGNLDIETSERIHNLFTKINKEKKQSIIVATHSTELANLASKKYEIKNGEFKTL